MPTRRKSIDKSNASTLLQRRREGLLVGAAIGTGMAANFAMRGGADFLLALNAGRLRSMGEPSLSAMLPLEESNRLVLDFGTREILPKAHVPVVFGAATFDPRQRIEDIVVSVRSSGFAGITNFPTATMIDGGFRQILEESDLGFARELALLRHARDAGLMTVAYTHTAGEAERAAAIGVDVINIGLGWNQGGARGVASLASIDDAGLYVDRVARMVRSLAPDILCMVEGGPIVSPRHLEELCRIANIDGYIGGSTIDRVPLETAIETMTASFKTIDRMRSRTDGSDDPALRNPLPPSLIGRSAEAQTCRSTFMRLAATDVPVLLKGGPGSGAGKVAEALHGLGMRRGRHMVSLHVGGKAAPAQTIELFGCAAGATPDIAKTRLGWIEVAHRSTLVLEEIEALPIGLLREITAFVRSRRIRRIGDEVAISADTRIIAILDSRSDRAAEIAEVLRPYFTQLELPPLADRPEDLPPVVEAVLQEVRERVRRPRLRLEPAAYRLLIDHDWPGDVLELLAILEQAALRTSDDVVTPLDLGPLSQTAIAGPSTAFASERDWILDALRRNQFRRSATARFLGVSRKTLYNKMQRLDLSGKSGGAE